MDFNWDDIRIAVDSSTTTELGGPERAVLAAATFKTHNAGTGVVPAFKAEYPAGDPSDEVQKAFSAAVQAAKAQRLAAPKPVADPAPTGPAPDPAAEKRAKLESLAQQADTARRATKSAADTADDAADRAETDAKAADKAAKEVEKIRRGSPEAIAARKTANDSLTAARNARTAATTAASRASDAATALQAAETVANGNGSVVDAEKAVGNASTAQKAAARSGEDVADWATKAQKARVKAESFLADAKETPEPKKAAAQRWLRAHTAKLALLAMIVVLLVCAFLALALRGDGMPSPGNEPTATATATTRGDGVFQTYPTLPPSTEDSTEDPSSTATP